MEKPKDRLRLARERAGFATPSEAARSIHAINKNTLISHENGNRDISRKAAEKYATAFNVKAGWLLYDEVSDEAQEGPPAPLFMDVPLISWVSAGELAGSDQDAVLDLLDFPTVTEADLPNGEWIALKVDGPSMNKISPPESVIFVNLKDRRLVANACYIIADETGAATYKRYRPTLNPQFQPASYEKIPAPKLEGAIRVVGRVRRSRIDM